MGINNKVFKNATWIVATKILQSLISLVIGMISARYLGPSGYGLITYASSIVTFIVPLVQLGFRNTIVQELISEPEREGTVMGTVLVSCMVSSIFGMIGVTSFAAIVNRGERDTIIVCALYSITLFFQMSEMIEYWFQSKLISKYISVTSLVAYTLVSLYRVYLLVTQKSIYWFAVVNALDYLLIAIALLVIYKKLGGQRLSFSFDLCKKMFGRSRHYIVSGLMVTIFSQTDRIMLKLMMDNAEAGYYSAAVTCAGVTSFVFLAVVDSFRPVILGDKKEGKASYTDNLKRLFCIIIYMGLAQSLVLCLMSGFIIKVLYGADYAAAAPVLAIVTWYTSFSYIGSARNIWILAEQKQSVLWIINLSGAVLNVVGNAVLIPTLGACGAAAASVLTQFFTNFVLCFIIKPVRPCGGMLIRSFNPNLLIGMLVKKRKS